jgi:hypothetical protein
MDPATWAAFVVFLAQTAFCKGDDASKAVTMTSETFLLSATPVDRIKVVVFTPVLPGIVVKAICNTDGSLDFAAVRIAGQEPAHA